MNDDLMTVERARLFLRTSPPMAIEDSLVAFAREAVADALAKEPTLRPLDRDAVMKVVTDYIGDLSGSDSIIDSADIVDLICRRFGTATEAPKPSKPPAEATHGKCMTWTPALAAEAAKLIAEVTPLCERATAGPWVSRPNQYDDWGWIRDALGDLVVVARIPFGMSGEDLNAHRMNGTDPTFNNRVFVEKSRTSLPRALSLLDAAMKRIAEVEMLHDQVGTVLSEEIDTLRARAEAAETALAEARRLGDAMATRKDYGHSGYCCRLCGQVWEEGERERHTPTCPVAAWREWRE